MEKSENRRADLATVGMGNVIRDMHDGRLDGVVAHGGVGVRRDGEDLARRRVRHGEAAQGSSW